MNKFYPLRTGALLTLLMLSTLFTGLAQSRPTAADSLSNRRGSGLQSADERPVTDPTRLSLPDSSDRPEVVTGPFGGLGICPGTPLSVPFAATGRFNADNRFVLQLLDPAGNVTPLGNPVVQAAGGPLLLSGTIPAGLAPGSRYALRVVATSPATNGTLQALRILPPPAARLELPDGSAAVTVLPGQSATLRVHLSGQGPWSFVLSDGTRVVNTLMTPYEVTVNPERPAVYRVLSVSGPCGTGAGTGEVIVNVSDNPTPQLALQAPAGGFRVCTGTPFSVPFNAPGRFRPDNQFIVQLAGDDGNWVNISAPGTASPLTAQLPYGIATRKSYRLRVIANSPALATEPITLNVAQQVMTSLRNDTIRVAEGQPADLLVDFTGGGPWFVLLSDGTYENGILKTPHRVRVTPNNSTAYRITAAGGSCGVGDFKGYSYVKVAIPPSTITTGNLSARTLCQGSEVTVPFTTAGRFNANNQFVVQVAEADGRFVNAVSTYRDGVLKAVINPGTMKEGDSPVRLRVVSTSPAVTGTETSVRLVPANSARVTLSGPAKVRPGQTARLQLSLQNGLPPWSFTLSDGSQVTGTFLNPYYLPLTPGQTTEYTITETRSSCGTGRGEGSVKVMVDAN